MLYKKIIAAIFFVSLSFFSAPTDATVGLLQIAVPSAPVAGCSQATTFLGRTSGLSTIESSSYTALICGMVSDGTYSLLDALYIFATNTTTTANLNLINTNFTISTGTAGFIPDIGYNGNGNSAALTTNYTPSTAGGNLTQNSASIGIVVQSTAVNSGGTPFGAGGGTPNSFLYFSLNTLVIGSEVNGLTFPTVAISSPKGAWTSTRSNSTTRSIYQNGNSTAIDTSSDPSTGLTSFPILLFAVNNGAGGAQDFSNAQISAAFIGGGLTGTQAAAINNRINTYLSSFGVNVY